MHIIILIYVYMHKYICIYVCHSFVNYDVLRQCQWDTSCRSRRDLSDALVKSDYHLTEVEI